MLENLTLFDKVFGILMTVLGWLGFQMRKDLDDKAPKSDLDRVEKLALSKASKEDLDNVRDLILDHRRESNDNFKELRSILLKIPHE